MSPNHAWKGVIPLTNTSTRLKITVAVLALLTLAALVLVTLVLIGETSTAHEFARSSWSTIALIDRSSWS